MIVSAVNIDGLEKMEQMEHLFNDVKYATISLDKDIKQIKEQYNDEILKLNVTAMKQRLQEEYSEFMKPTYEFLLMERFPLMKEELGEYLANHGTLLKDSCERLKKMVAIVNELSEYGLIKEWNYGNLTGLVELLNSLNSDLLPTKYWFDLSKFDFMQELINEAQTKVEEYQKARKRLTKDWSMKALEPEQVAALDYYMRQKDSSLKLFDLTFHKSKKMLKDLFTDESRRFQNSEVEELEKNVYTMKRNEYWITKNYSRIRQFWGQGYNAMETDFIKLRRQYAIVYKLSGEFTTQDMRNQLVDVMIEEKRYVELKEFIDKLKEELSELPYEQLMEALPCNEQVAALCDMNKIEKTVTDFTQMVEHLHGDLVTICNYRLLSQTQEAFSIEDMRKLLYNLERVVKKQDWLKRHKAKIKEVFRNEEITLDTDWNALKDRFFRTDIKDQFPAYVWVDKSTWVAGEEEEQTLTSMLRAILKAESPIKEELLYRRVVQVMNLPRMTPKMKLEIRRLLEEELHGEYVQEDEFIYPKEQETLELRIYKNEEKREIDTIAPKELKAGIVKLIQLNYEMTLDEISKEMAGLLQYPRRTKKFNEIIEKKVKELQRECMIRRYSGGFRVETY